MSKGLEILSKLDELMKYFQQGRDFMKELYLENEKLRNHLV
jgi:hypothetical protein